LHVDQELRSLGASFGLGQLPLELDDLAILVVALGFGLGSALLRLETGLAVAITKGTPVGQMRRVQALAP